MKVGFIGAGNMGGALCAAAAKTENEVIISDIDLNKAKEKAALIGCKAADNETVAKTAKYIFMGVKPHIMKSALCDILSILKNRTDRFVLVSMAAALTVEKIKEFSDISFPVIRIMPNTPVSVGKGVVLYTASEEVTDSEKAEFEGILKFAGLVEPIDEKLIDAGSALYGCGPAFVFMFSEALADAGVECGLTRDKALRLAAATINGAGELMLKSDKHPGVLKDEVCSPGGTTIAGVHALEEGSFRGVVMDAVKAAYDKTKLLGK